MRKRYRRTFIIIMGILLFGGIAIRIGVVNQKRHITEVKTYDMGERVELGEDYFLEEYEIARDYAITAEWAEIMSCEEFLKECGYEGSVDDLFPVKTLIFPEMVYVVDVTVENIGQEEKEERGINFSFFDLAAADYRLQISDELYAVANPQMENGTMMFRLRPQSKMSFRLPYYFSVTAPNSYLTPEEAMTDEIYMVLSIYPTQKQIRIRPEG